MREPSSESAEYRRQWRLIRNAILFTVFIGLLGWVGYVVRDVLLLVYISALLAIGLTPIVRFIERSSPVPATRLRPPRWLAILTIYLAIVAFVALLGRIIVPPLVRQGTELVRVLPSMLDRLLAYAIRLGLVSRTTRIEDLLAGASPQAAGVVPKVLSVVLGFVGGVFGLVTILVLTFYLLLDSYQMFQAFLRLFPPQHRSQVDVMGRKIAVKVSAWMGGQLLLGASMCVAVAIGLGLMGIPYFIVLGFFAGIAELIPIVGPILAAIPAILVALTESPVKALIVVLFFFVVQQTEGHVLVPKIMQRRVGIDPVAVLVALLIGARLAGIIGALLAVPTAAILQVLVQEFLAAREARAP